MNFWDLMPLLGELLAKIEALKAGADVPIRWSKRKGKYRYSLVGTVKREEVKD